MSETRYWIGGSLYIIPRVVADAIDIREAELKARIAELEEVVDRYHDGLEEIRGIANSETIPADTKLRRIEDLAFQTL